MGDGAVTGTVPDFRPGGDFTLGVEDELMLVDDAGELLSERAVPLVSALVGSHVGPGHVVGEVYADQVEVTTAVCRDGDEVLAALTALRSHVTASARVMSSGVHPTAALGAAVTSPSSRYDRIVGEFAGLLRTPTAAFQVHVGLPDEQSLMLAYRGLRRRLPLLRAIAAATPYWHGVDSGLASARSAVIRSYPRHSVPPLLHTWEEYVARAEALLVAAGAPDDTYVWWDLRPRPLIGTLEVRVMDAVPSVELAAGLASLVQGIARRAVERPDDRDPSDDVLGVNDDAAIRHGLDARVVDDDQVRRPLREVAVRVLAEARETLDADGRAAPLHAVERRLAADPEPDRQRQLVASEGMPALLLDLVARTTHPEA
ncbi:glutamate-cysteine ligase family protein [Nocardioides KLBMP 9356]|uniref:Putative glutamate--cysteine ligase 2 n=1 Tax=Nocardioides potassii TaxID=2911371 RepID=A0ABS9HFK4_9ACTN|nr:glutamate-cysteine ligase family protein [Nocardioides potassii]MCF6379920.1 glutamate-cysteine ligase family protein [Nocardioides potassii]